MNPPVLTYTDQNGNPLTTIYYVQSSTGGNNIPVLQGEVSNSTLFRIYNNFALATGISSAINVSLTVYDGAGAGSHTCLLVPVAQSWVSIQLYGYGEGTTDPGLFTYYLGTLTAIGGTAPCGSNSYTPEKGSDGTSNAYIRAGSTTNGVGFLEFQTSARLPQSVASNQAYNFAISMLYEYVL